MWHFQITVASWRMSIPWTFLSKKHPTDCDFRQND